MFAPGQLDNFPSLESIVQRFRGAWQSDEVRPIGTRIRQLERRIGELANENARLTAALGNAEGANRDLLEYVNAQQSPEARDIRETMLALHDTDSWQSRWTWCNLQNPVGAVSVDDISTAIENSRDRCREEQSDEWCTSIDDSHLRGKGYGVAFNVRCIIRTPRVECRGDDGRIAQHRQFLRELHVRTIVCHEHLVLLIGVCAPMCALVYPCPDCTLDQLVAASPALGICSGVSIICGAAKGLQALHVADIVHRNIRTSNVHVFNVEAGGVVGKLSGFLYARSRYDADTESMDDGGVVGSAPYLDPEYLRTQRFLGCSDVFSLGVVLLEVLLARPYIAHNVAEASSSESQEENIGATRRWRQPSVWCIGEDGAGASAADMARVLESARCSDAGDTEWQPDHLEAAAALLSSMLCTERREHANGEASGIPGGLTAWQSGELASNFRPSSAEVVSQLSWIMEQLKQVPCSLPKSASRICVVCMDAAVDAKLEPCGHAALCMTCASEILGRGEHCPICRNAVEHVSHGEFLRTFQR